jgi:ketosteroid isomerase-like protein
MVGGSIEDRLAISDLFVRYATALDAGDVATVVACFTADAVLESPAIGSIAGREAIREFAGRFAALREAGTQFRHLITNLAAEVNGDRARATAYRRGNIAATWCGRTACGASSAAS